MKRGNKKKKKKRHDRYHSPKLVLTLAGVRPLSPVAGVSPLSPLDAASPPSPLSAVIHAFYQQLEHGTQTVELVPNDRL